MPAKGRRRGFAFRWRSLCSTGRRAIPAWKRLGAFAVRAAGQFPVENARGQEVEFLMLWIAAPLTLALLAYWLLCENLARHILRPGEMSWEKAEECELRGGGLRPGELAALPLEEHTLTSRDGTRIWYAWIMNPAPRGNRAVILAHGYTCAAVQSVKYARLFLRRGYHVMLYDQRYYGHSGGRYTTMGCREREDLRCLMDAAAERLGPNAFIGTHGESMGAATAVMHACIDPRVRFCVADCPYADFEAETLYRARRIARVSVRPLLPLTDWICRSRAGFRLRDANPLAALREADGLPHIPMLFFHGGEDTYVPPWHSERLYEAKAGMKRRVVIPGAGHAKCLLHAPQTYREELFAFLRAAEEAADLAGERVKPGGEAADLAGERVKSGGEAADLAGEAANPAQEE